MLIIKKKPVRSGARWSPGSTGAGDRNRTLWSFWTSPSVIMGVSEEDDWKSDSGEDDTDDQGNDDVQEVIHTTSASGGSLKSILLFPERNEEDTWLVVT